MRLVQDKGDKKLHILGKVAAPVIKALQGEKLSLPNHIWLFVGYDFNNFKKGSSFDIVASKDNNNWNHDYKFKLEKIVDEYNTTHSSIPEGFKSICLFKCEPSIPTYIKSLPTLKTWDFSEDGIYLCNHSDIDLFVSGNSNNIMFQTIAKLFIKNLEEQEKTWFTLAELMKGMPKESEFIIDNLLINGTLEKESDKNGLIRVAKAS